MGRFTVPKPRTEAMKNTVMYKAMTFWNYYLPAGITEIKAKGHFKTEEFSFINGEIVTLCLISGNVI